MTGEQMAALYRQFFPRTKMTSTQVSFVRACLSLVQDGRAMVLDGLLSAQLARDVEVQQWMFDAARGKRPMPTSQELREWALRLGAGPAGEQAFADMRSEFEAFVGGPPFEYETERYPEDDVRYAWPGSYKNIGVDLAWQAWCERGRRIAPPKE